MPPTQKVWLRSDPAWAGPDLLALCPEIAGPPENPGPADVIVTTRPEFERIPGVHHIVVGQSGENDDDVTYLNQAEALPAVLSLALAKQRRTRPLRAILGFARLALNTQLNRSQREYLEAIFRSAQEVIPPCTRASRWSLTSGSDVPGLALRVLVADDNPVSQAMAVLALEGQGHEVVPACDGETVLQLVAEQSFDLVLLDVHMPGLDGYLTTRAIREKERGSMRHLPIVAVTAHSREGDAEMCLAAGMDGFVAKPVREQELLEVMQEVLGWSDERPTSSEPKILNREGLRRRLGGREDHLHRVIRQFLNMLPKQLEEVYQSFGRGDHEGLAGSLHRLKCSALAFESPRILEPISRLEGAARRPLGLAESGAVLARLRSELEQLKLELIEVDRSLQEPEVPKATEGNWPGLERPLRVLLAEDNPINQTLVISLLEEHPCQVEVAENGQEALQLWQNGQFDVILLDIQMPVMDGLEALGLLRERETSHTPVVVMTASSREGDGQKYLQAGADHYLSKPIEEDELLSALAGVLAQKHEEPASEPELIDVEALGLRLNFKMERLARLSQLFQQVLPEHLQELRQAISQRNSKELERSAHRYKTTLRSIEARRSFLQAQQLELMGREGALEGSLQLLEQLCAESEQIRQKLDQLLVEATVLAHL